jgi:hypothetical protein
MKIMYRVGTFYEIRPCNVTKETPHKITFLAGSNEEFTRTENKESSYHAWFDTWENAHAYVVAKCEKEVESCEMKLERAKGRLGQVRGMKKPEGTP